MGIVNVDALVAGLGPSGAAALARLERAGVDAVGLEARDPEGARANIVFVDAATRRLISRLARGKSSPMDLLKLPAGQPVNAVESALRGAVAASGATAHYNSAVSDVQRLADGSSLVHVADSDDAYRAKYLIDGSGGRAPGLATLAPVLQSVPGKDSYVISFSAHSVGPPTLLRHIKDAAGVRHHVNIARSRFNPEYGTEIATRMHGDAPADPAAFDDLMRTGAGISAPRSAPPTVINIEPKLTNAAHHGTVLLTGDGISRVHPGTHQGLNLAVRDGVNAADAVTAALRATDSQQAAAALDHYDQQAMAAHRAAVAKSAKYLVAN